MRVNFFGDICLHGIDWKQFRFDPALLTVMDGALNVGNLECPITHHTEEKPLQVRNLRAAPESLGLLRGFAALSLANNHMQDYGEQGCIDTLAAVQEAGIGYFGLGPDQQSALAPLIIERGGVRLALLGATRYANAQGAHHGTASERTGILQRIIRRLKTEGCFVVPYFHWGYEYVHVPSPRERRIAHACIDAGADLVIGAHPHVWQARETYRGKHVFYSLGNFVFHSSVFDGLSPIPNDPRLNQGLLIAVDISSDHSYAVKVHPVWLQDDAAGLLDEADAETIRAEMRTLAHLLEGPRLGYLRAYYQQTRAIAAQNVRVRNRFQVSGKRTLADLVKTYTAFNSQDLMNRVAAKLPQRFWSQ